VTKPPAISVIIPVFNEAANLPHLHRRLVATLERLRRAAPTRNTYEVIYVDDGSSDRSLALLASYARGGSGIRVVELLRNFGQHMAVFAGMDHARGEVIVTLDADLQNPPEEIPKLVAKIRQGYDVAAGWRQSRQDFWWRKMFSRMTNGIISRATGVMLHDYGCMLRAYSRPVMEAMRSGRETVTFIPALANSYAKRIAEVKVAHAERTGGDSKYSFRKLIRLYFDLMTGFTLLPIQLIGLAGALIGLTGFGFGVFLMIRRYFVGAEVEGVFTLFAILFAFVGIEILAVALIGEYVGRIYANVNGRPAYRVRRVVEGKER
jgi:undecaprenyl-phosphate 4-deoxy-4-formamido-L-arabinose transferase